MKYDFLVVGAGFSGSVLAERITSVMGKTVLLVDKRNHIGGNCYDYRDENGILIHQYGPHAFHTVNQRVVDYLSQFTEWTDYEHKVLAEIDGKRVPVPFNLNSLKICFSELEAEIIEKDLIAKFGYGNKVPILKLRETDNENLRKLADYVYRNIFYGYTVKQWAMTPEQIDKSVTGRIPVVISHDDRYFHDTFQKIPKLGYTELFRNMLNNKKISISLNSDFFNLSDDIEYDKLIYTGPVDTYFNNKFGSLPYRSLRFDFQTYNLKRYQETAQVNFPNEFDYTRITEFGHFYNTDADRTVVAFEYPEKYNNEVNEPYYPVPRKENEELFRLYAAEMAKLEGKVFFIGRLADYKYYNMDQVVGVALQFFDKKIMNFYV